MSGGLAKDFRPLAKQAVAAGWALETSNGVHPILVSPDRTVRIPMTGTGTGKASHRLLWQARCKLRQHGVLR